MAEITKVGPERCLMHRPEPSTPQHKWMCKMAHGSERILILIQAGWKIVEDDRNHVVNDYGQSQVEVKRRGRPKKMKK